MYTTLDQIRSHSPCQSGWAKLLRTLNKTQADDEPLTMDVILASNGLADAIWCLRAMPDADRLCRLFAVFCAKQNMHLLKDVRSLKAIEVAEAYADGQASAKELSTARKNAAYAAYAADAAATAAAYAADAATDAAYVAYAATYAYDATAATATAYAAAVTADAAAYVAAYAAHVVASADAADAASETSEAAGAHAAQRAELLRLCSL